MKKVKEAQDILRELGLPKAQQNERSAMTLLALAGVRPNSSWKNASQTLLRTVDIMQFIRDIYHKNYKPNTRETIRRQTLHQFMLASLVELNPDDPKRPTNSGKNCYSLTPAAVTVIQSYGKVSFAPEVRGFLSKYGKLQEAYARKRDLPQIPVIFPDGCTVALSLGKHNELQKAIIEEFGPRFASGAKILYLGDTAQKDVKSDRETLAQLRIPFSEHDKLPDIVMYSPQKRWLYLIEAVTSHGPIHSTRIQQLAKLVKKCPADVIYVTAFASRDSFRKYSAEIAWETEVWIAEEPDHLIHFNGSKFLGPYSR